MGRVEPGCSEEIAVGFVRGLRRCINTFFPEPGEELGSMDFAIQLRIVSTVSGGDLEDLERQVADCVNVAYEMLNTQF